MAQNGTGIEFGKSEHDKLWRISRATTVSADFIVLGQRCGVQVFHQKVGHIPRWYPVYGFMTLCGKMLRTRSEAKPLKSPVQLKKHTPYGGAPGDVTHFLAEDKRMGRSGKRYEKVGNR